MASLRPISHRRRSRSVSSPGSVSRRSSDSIRIATKRAHPSHACHAHDSTPHICEVDAWRRGKRRRHHFSPSDVTMNFSPPLEKHHTPHAAAFSGYAFSTSPADFNFFPSSRQRASCSPAKSESGLSNKPNHTELSHLRSNAFWDLRRSVAENGEGFVQRMRDYERARSFQTSGPLHRGRKLALQPQPTRNTPLIHSDESEDDDDVQIFAGDISVHSTRPSNHGKRAGMVDVPCHYSRMRGDDYYMRSGQQFQTPLSSPSSNDALALPATTGPPLSPSALSLTSTSQSSLSSPVESRRPDIDEWPTSTSASTFASTFLHDQGSAVSSDKAILDLTYALASGVGNIDDYGCFQNLTNFRPTDGGESGELWH